jgi:polyisoprenoid-binding protein YceI
MASCALVLLALVLLALSDATLARAQAPNTNAIDPAKSTARFSIEHIFVERVTGTVPIVSGTVEVSAHSVIPRSVSAILDATRIQSGDPDRDRSLESPDYFDTAKFPTWTFTSTKIVPADATGFGMDGILTMHGVPQAEHLDVTVSGSAAHPAYHAVGHIDRHAFGMKGARLDPVIGNEADITLDITLK